MMKYSLFSAIICAALCGCVVKQDVVKLGPDTYSVSADAVAAAGGVTAARTTALKIGAQYCRSAGLEFLALNIAGQTVDMAGGGNVNVTFRCLQANDPELKRPNYERPPDIIIQNRNG